MKREEKMGRGRVAAGLLAGLIGIFSAGFSAQAADFIGPVDPRPIMHSGEELSLKVTYHPSFETTAGSIGFIAHSDLFVMHQERREPVFEINTMPLRSE